MKLLATIVALCVSVSAQAFSGSLSVQHSSNETKEKVSQNVGLTVSHPLMLGLGWWSWSGIGQTFEKEAHSAWGQTVQGLEWNFRDFKVGGSAKFQLENDFKDYSAEYAVKLGIKLW